MPRGTVRSRGPPRTALQRDLPALPPKASQLRPTRPGPASPRPQGRPAVRPGVLPRVLPLAPIQSPPHPPPAGGAAGPGPESRRAGSTHPSAPEAGGCCGGSSGCASPPPSRPPPSPPPPLSLRPAPTRPRPAPLHLCPQSGRRSPVSCIDPEAAFPAQQQHVTLPHVSRSLREGAGSPLERIPSTKLGLPWRRRRCEIQGFIRNPAYSLYFLLHPRCRRVRIVVSE